MDKRQNGQKVEWTKGRKKGRMDKRQNEFKNTQLLEIYLYKETFKRRL